MIPVPRFETDLSTSLFTSKSGQLSKNRLLGCSDLDHGNSIDACEVELCEIHDKGVDFQFLVTF